VGKWKVGGVSPQETCGLAKVVDRGDGLVQCKRYERLRLSEEPRQPEIIFQSYLIEGNGCEGGCFGHKTLQVTVDRPTIQKKAAKND